MENPRYIIILKFKQEDDSFLFKALSIMEKTESVDGLLQAAHAFVGYSDENPMNTQTCFGLLRDTFVRPCSLTLKQREEGVRFRLLPSGEMTGPVLSNSSKSHRKYYNTDYESVHCAPHIILY